MTSANLEVLVCWTLSFRNKTCKMTQMITSSILRRGLYLAGNIRSIISSILQLIDNNVHCVTCVLTVSVQCVLTVVSDLIMNIGHTHLHDIRPIIVNYQFKKKINIFISIDKNIDFLSIMLITLVLSIMLIRLVLSIMLIV